MKAGWWDAPLTLQVLVEAISNQQNQAFYTFSFEDILNMKNFYSKNLFIFKILFPFLSILENLTLFAYALFCN